MTNYRLMQVEGIAELRGGHSAILSTFIKLPFVIKNFVIYFEWPFYTFYTVLSYWSAQESAYACYAKKRNVNRHHSGMYSHNVQT